MQPEVLRQVSLRFYNDMQTILLVHDKRMLRILKPIRSGKGDGTVFGDDITQKEWTSILTELSATGLPLEEACAVQRRIVPREYDLLFKASTGMVRYPLVGTYPVINNKPLGLGIWRASGGRIVAISSGGSWVCSVVKREDGEKATCFHFAFC